MSQPGAEGCCAFWRALCALVGAAARDGGVWACAAASAGLAAEGLGVSHATQLPSALRASGAGVQVDTLLRTAYELQDGLSRSAGHARKPLPSLEQARCLPELLLSALQWGVQGRCGWPALCLLCRARILACCGCPSLPSCALAEHIMLDISVLVVHEAWSSHRGKLQSFGVWVRRFYSLKKGSLPWPRSDSSGTSWIITSVKLMDCQGVCEAL